VYLTSFEIATKQPLGGNTYSTKRSIWREFESIAGFPNGGVISRRRSGEGRREVVTIVITIG